MGMMKDKLLTIENIDKLTGQSYKGYTVFASGQIYETPSLIYRFIIGTPTAQIVKVDLNRKQNEDYPVYMMKITDYPDITGINPNLTGLPTAVPLCDLSDSETFIRIVVDWIISKGIG